MKEENQRKGRGYSMQAMVCELCGSTNIVKKDDMFQCQHCGAKYSVEEAKKLIGSVKSVNNQTEKYLTLARRAKEKNNAENAAKYYELVLLENPMSWEAAFYTVYFKAMECRIIDIESAVYSVANNISGTIRLIHDTVTSGEQAEAVTEVITRSAVIVNKFATAAMNLYNSFSQVDGVRSECSDHIVAAGSILNQLENGLKSYFTGNKQSIVEVQKLQLSYISNYAKMYNKEYRNAEINRLTNEIRQQDSSFTPPEVETGGCYVATAVYGSYDCPQVWTLRRYRDDTLAKTWYGRAFVRTYYAVSPTLVKWFGETAWFKKLWRGKLDNMVKRLNAEGYENTPYRDKNW